MSRKIKILYFIDTLGIGGIQPFFCSIARRLIRMEFEIEFLILDDGETPIYEQTVRDMGIAVHKLQGIWIDKPFDYIPYIKALRQFFKEHHNYDIVHLNGSSKNFMVLRYAMKYNVPVRVFHSHSNSFVSTSRIKNVFGNLLKIIMRRYTTDYIAVSKEAAEWMFGMNIVQNHKVWIMRCTIEGEKYRYDENLRRQLREQYYCEDKFVIGHAGRFSYYKNHDFLIDVFAKVHQMKQNTVLVLCGSGELEEKIRNKVISLGLMDDVYFLGWQPFERIANMMDLFIFPSIEEAYGLVVVEAQMNGLPCVVGKESITDDVKVTELVREISMQETAEDWAKKIVCQMPEMRRKDVEEKLVKKGYIIEDSVRLLSMFYRAVLTGDK